jgi:translation initiation factor 2 beta subunit (eIF-2beta)/eIF-5
MNEQLEQRTYSAVLCRTCREPIPVPAIVIRLQEESNEAGSAEPQHDRVFRLRCRACGAEKPYRSSQVIEVDGEPKVRRAMRAASGDFRIAKAAGA